MAVLAWNASETMRGFKGSYRGHLNSFLCTLRTGRAAGSNAKHVLVPAINISSQNTLAGTQSGGDIGISAVA